MRIGFGLPSMGDIAGRDAVIKAAQRAEELDYDSVWVVERLLYPVEPQTPYPATPDGSLPETYKRVLDPVETLTFAAAHTQKIALGTSVLDMPYYNPVMLARRLTSLDILSEGRLRVGLGLGWSKDEYDAAGATFKQRGSAPTSFSRCSRPSGPPTRSSFTASFSSCQNRSSKPKPVQKPHPPIYLGAFVPAALKRVAKYGDAGIRSFSQRTGSARCSPTFRKWPKPKDATLRGFSL